MSKLHLGDCMDVMKSMPGNSIDAVITDPPYGLSFMGKGWDSFGKRSGVSEMAAFQENMTPVFAEALRVAKPGAHLLCFGGTRTFHRMACAIEDAGWEIRDTVMWTYGSGFPKSMNVGKAIDKALGAERKVVGRKPEHVISRKWREREGRGDIPTGMLDITVPATDEAAKWDGWGTCLKPAWEPIIVARKPLDGTVAHNVLTWGVGAMNIDACRVPTEDNLNGGAHSKNGGRTSLPGDERTAAGMGMFAPGARCKEDYVQPSGRFPANLVHDGSQMVLDLFPDTGKSSGGGMHTRGTAGEESTNAYGVYTGGTATKSVGLNDSGSAARYFNTLRDGEESADRVYKDRGGTNFAAKPGARREPTSADRFFYCAKASKKDRGEGNNHPTVKPTALMEWLVKLVTPEGGTVLDPFMGSGSTGVACANLGREFVGIEREWDYMRIAGPRVADREREMLG